MQQLFDRPGTRTYAERLRLFTDSSNKIHEEYLHDSQLLRQYDYFLAWQTEYSLPFYAEFQQYPETAAAVDFVVSDLIGTGISARDSDLARVVPVMTRLLPDKALQALAAAVELNARVLAINLEICRHLFEVADPNTGISERDYCLAFRQSTTLDECLELVGLTTRLGKSLKRIIRIPIMGATLRAMHRPAHAAGFGALQDFLEKAYITFRSIPDVDYFLDRLSQLMTQIFSRTCQEPLENLDSTQFHPVSMQ